MSIKDAIAFRELQERVATLAALMEQLEHFQNESR